MIAKWTAFLALLTAGWAYTQERADSSVVELLQQRARTTRVELNAMLNAARMDSLRAAVGQAPDWPRSVRLQFQLGDQLLRAGRTRESIEVFAGLLEQLQRRPSPAPLRGTWPVHAFLGLAHMRLGEQENCLHHHNTESCLLPVSAAGVHKLQQGSRRALAEYGAVLAQRPEDGGVRWLLNIAHMTLGEYPRQVPAEWVLAPEVFASEVDVGKFHNVASALGLDALGLSGGSIVEDFDGDGWLDVMASSWGLTDPLRLFANGGDGTFAERTGQAGLAGQVGGLNIVHADYDNNGYADVLVLRGAWWNEEGHHPNSLLRNDGGRFSDVTRASGLLSFHPTQTAAWGDYDNDGFVDLYIGNESNDWERHPCELFHNDGGRTFSERAAAAGVDNVGYVKGVVWGDYDNDGDIDLFLSRMGQVNALYRNEGGQGFRELGMAAGVGEPVWSFPTWFFDYDNDGWLDLFVAGYDNDAIDIAAVYLGEDDRAARPRLYRNVADGTFIAVDAGIEGAVLAMGANYGDLDNDGFPDFYLGTGNPDLRSLLPNRMYRNDGGRRFQDATTAGGFGHLQKGHGVSFGDLDNDGDQDIYQVMGGAYSGDVYYNALYANPGHGNRWVTLVLEGTASSRDAIGARLRVRVVKTGGVREIHVVAGSGGSFGGSSLQQELGLGRAEAIELVEVRWPATGAVERFAGVGLDRVWRLREGAGRAELLARGEFDLTRAVQGHQ
jgi:hypothetical protein